MKVFRMCAGHQPVNIGAELNIGQPFDIVRRIPYTTFAEHWIQMCSNTLSDGNDEASIMLILSIQPPSIAAIIFLICEPSPPPGALRYTASPSIRNCIGKRGSP